MNAIWIEVGAYRFLVEKDQPKHKIGAVMPAPDGSYIGIVMSRTKTVEDFRSGPYTTIDDVKRAIEEELGDT